MTMLGSWNPESERANIAGNIDLQQFIAGGDEHLVVSTCQKLSAEKIAAEAMDVAADICVFTNKNITIENL